jgi:hypothetical protein
MNARNLFSHNKISRGVVFRNTIYAQVNHSHLKSEPHSPVDIGAFPRTGIPHSDVRHHSNVSIHKTSQMFASLLVR